MKVRILWLLFFLLLANAAPSFAAPANDLFSRAKLLTGYPINISGSIVGATGETFEPPHYGYEPYASVWFKWTAPDNGIVTIDTLGSNFDTILAVYSGNALWELVEVASNDDIDFDNDVYDSRVSFSASAGATFWIAVDTVDSVGFFLFNLSVEGGFETPGNDNYENAAPLSGGVIDVFTHNFGATLQPGELTPTPDGGTSLWWTWEAPTSERYRITTADSDFDTVLSVYDGESLVAWNDDSADDHSSALYIKAVAGRTYHISVQGFQAAVGAIALHIFASPPAPAPAFNLTDMNGEPISLEAFKGKVVMLDFWATWCGPCISEIPDFINMQNEYGPDGFVIIGISTDVEGWDVVTPFVQNNGVNYISTLSTGQIEQAYGPIEFIPTTYIISREGQIEERIVGAMTRERFDSILLPLLYPPAIEVSLAANREGDELVLTWPTTAVGYIIQSSNDISTPDNWSNLDVIINVSNEFNVARVTITGNQWFRLVHK